MNRILIAALALCVCLTASADAWKNLDDEHWCSGKKLTEDDLAGKVVLVDCWGVNCPPCRQLLPRMESIWNGFKAKQFMLIGSHRQGNQADAIKELVTKNKLTYPVYNSVGLVEEPSFSSLPYMYVVNHRGKIVYKGSSERDATEAVVEALTRASQPLSLTGDVIIRKYKGLAKQLVLGKNITTTVKKLQKDAEKAKDPVMKEEAGELLNAIADAKDEAKQEIASLKRRNPTEALKLIGLYKKTWPKEAAEFAADEVELKERIAAEKAEKKAGK